MANNKYYVYSKMANGITFVEYHENNTERGVNMPKNIIAINGGAGIADKVTRQVKDYVETVITKEEYDFLSKDISFLTFVAGGVMWISQKQLRDNEVKQLLNGRDGCGSFTEETIRAQANANGVTHDFKVKTVGN